MLVLRNVLVVLSAACSLAGCAVPEGTGQEGTETHAPFTSESYTLFLFLESAVEPGGRARMAVDVTGDRPGEGAMALWVAPGDDAPDTDEEPCAAGPRVMREGHTHVHISCQVPDEGNHTAMVRLTMEEDGTTHSWKSNVVSFTTWQSDAPPTGAS